MKYLLLLAFMAFSIIAHAQNPGSLDMSFNPGMGANSFVNTIALQPDGKVIIAGAFSSFDGMPRNHIVRLNADGTMDGSFTVGTGANEMIQTIALQPDGKIVIGGWFTSYNGTTRNRIARLNADGTLDDSFTVGSGANAAVYATAVQADGKIIIGGQFNFYGGTARFCIARLNADGTLDDSFTVGAGATGADLFNTRVNTTAIQPDGKIIIGGSFTEYDGIAINRVARLNADGSLDDTFTVGTGASGSVRTTAVQQDGEIIIGGEFTSYNGTAINRVARLNSDGTLDDSFTVGSGATGAVCATAVQADGKIVIGGLFNIYNATSSRRIARLNADGSLDGSFTLGTGADAVVNSTTIQPDGKIIIGGDFTSYDGTAINRIARLNGDVTVGVDAAAPSELSIYPNPSSGLYTLALGEVSGTVQLTVTDITGREVWADAFTSQGGRSQHTIDLTSEAKGIYTLQLQTSQGTITRKLVKN
jgi:uncharacterized delta-60 repeat protein